MRPSGSSGWRGPLLWLAGLAIALALAIPVGSAPAPRGRLPRVLAGGPQLRHRRAALPRLAARCPAAQVPAFRGHRPSPRSRCSRCTVAAILMSLLNLGLWVVAVGLTRQIVARTLPDRTPARCRLVLAFILSAQFFLDNFHHVQMNEVTFVLALLGIKAYCDGSDVTSAAAFVAATALKITPIFFAAWLVIRGRRRAALAVFPIALACLLVPMVLRGPSRGVDELQEYTTSFSGSISTGNRVGTRRDRNIAGVVKRMPLAPRLRDQSSFQRVPATRAGGAAHLPRSVRSPCWSCSGPAGAPARAPGAARRRRARHDLRDVLVAQPHQFPRPTSCRCSSCRDRTEPPGRSRAARARGGARDRCRHGGLPRIERAGPRRRRVPGRRRLQRVGWTILALFGVSLVRAGRAGLVMDGAPKP